MEMFGKSKIKLRYFTGHKWKRLVLKNEFNTENVAVYTRFVMDSVIKDICGKEKDILKRDAILKGYESDVMCIVQLNNALLEGATKLFM